MKTKRIHQFEFEEEAPNIMDEIQLRFAVTHFLATHTEKEMFEIILEEVENART